MVILRRAPALGAGAVHLGDAQRAALESGSPVLRVLGGPGAGKSTLAVEMVVAAVSGGGRADECLILTPTRLAAATLRERVTQRLGGTSTESLARTWQAFGFGILRAEAALRGDPPPRLLNGPEQDVILRDLLAGHASGLVPGPDWPESVRAALGTRGFRNELRDLLMRAVEHGQGPDDLRDMGIEHDRAEWVAAADVLREYDQVTSFSRHGSYDPAWVLTAAADRLEDDEAALARLRERLAIVVVDDAQEITASAARLLHVIAPAGPRIVLLGDPDSAVQTFRGAEPRFLAHGWESLGATSPEVLRLQMGGPGRRDGTAVHREPLHDTVVLDRSHRLRGPLIGVALRVSRRIGALGGAGQRAMSPAAGTATVDVALLRSAAQETSHIAGLLRRAHLVEGIPWSDMAVIVRGSGRASTMRRLLGQAGVPVLAGTAVSPVRDEPAVRPLLSMLEECVAIARVPARGGTGGGHAIDPTRAADLLLSPLGGSDTVGLRRLRRLLRQDELAGGGGRSSDELIADLLLHPVRAKLLGTTARPAERIAVAIAAGVDAARVGRDGRWVAGVTAETVLWAIWEGVGVAQAWRRQALAGGPAGERADRDLDAVLALFDAAGAFVDRLPTAGPDKFLEHVLGQDLPGDTLLIGGQGGARVEMLTPQTAAGREWRIVVVAGVQEGVWPDLRLRGSILGSEALVDAVAERPSGFRAAQAAIRYDETRLSTSP